METYIKEFKTFLQGLPSTKDIEKEFHGTFTKDAIQQLIATNKGMDCVRELMKLRNFIKTNTQIKEIWPTFADDIFSVQESILNGLKDNVVKAPLVKPEVNLSEKEKKEYTDQLDIFLNSSMNKLPDFIKQNIDISLIEKVFAVYFNSDTLQQIVDELFTEIVVERLNVLQGLLKPGVHDKWARIQIDIKRIMQQLQQVKTTTLEQWKSIYQDLENGRTDFNTKRNLLNTAIRKNAPKKVILKIIEVLPQLVLEPEPKQQSDQVYQDVSINLELRKNEPDPDIITAILNANINGVLNRDMFGKLPSDRLSDKKCIYSPQVKGAIAKGLLKYEYGLVNPVKFNLFKSIYNQNDTDNRVFKMFLSKYIKEANLDFNQQLELLKEINVEIDQYINKTRSGLKAYLESEERMKKGEHVPLHIKDAEVLKQFIDNQISLVVQQQQQQADQIGQELLQEEQRDHDLGVYELHKQQQREHINYLKSNQKVKITPRNQSQIDLLNQQRRTNTANYNQNLQNKAKIIQSNYKRFLAQKQANALRQHGRLITGLPTENEMDEYIGLEMARDVLGPDYVPKLENRIAYNRLNTSAHTPLNVVLHKPKPLAIVNPRTVNGFGHGFGKKRISLPQLVKDLRKVLN